MSKSGTTSGTTLPLDRQQTQLGIPEPPKRKTHGIAGAVEFFKKLPLLLKLKKNKEIEQENDTRLEKQMNHLVDPAKYPDDGSSVASYFSLSENELDSLHDPLILESVQDTIPYYLAKELHARKAKRKLSADDEDEQRLAKRRCRDGNTMIPYNIAMFKVFFPQIYFETANVNVVIPLSFFIPQNVRYIAANLAYIPTKRANAMDGSRGAFIIDTERMTKDKQWREMFRPEGEISYDEFFVAGRQFVAFEGERDKDAEGGSWKSVWEDHFSFFHKHHKAHALYDYWKEEECRMRRLCITQNVAYTFDDRLQVLDAATNTKRMDGTICAMAGSSSSRNQRALNRSSSAHAICIFCAEQGHTVFEHPNPTKATSFPDGTPTWAKIHVSQAGNVLQNPDGKDICVRFNIRGKEFTESLCKHGRKRLHVCSFCGSKGHHAFAWVCRRKPSN